MNQLFHFSYKQNNCNFMRFLFNQWWGGITNIGIKPCLYCEHSARPEFNNVTLSKNAESGWYYKDILRNDEIKGYPKKLLSYMPKVWRWRKAKEDSEIILYLKKLRCDNWMPAMILSWIMNKERCLWRTWLT